MLKIVEYFNLIFICFLKGVIMLKVFVVGLECKCRDGYARGSFDMVGLIHILNTEI